MCFFLMAIKIYRVVYYIFLMFTQYSNYVLPEKSAFHTKTYKTNIDIFKEIIRSNENGAATKSHLL